GRGAPAGSDARPAAFRQRAGPRRGPRGGRGRLPAQRGGVAVPPGGGGDGRLRVGRGGRLASRQAGCYRWVTSALVPLRCAMSDFSLELNEDQLQIQKWVHDFAEDVVRPAAHEWDEREETPWPIIEEAAKIGLYSFEFVANAF